MRVPWNNQTKCASLCRHQVRFRWYYVLWFDHTVCDKCGKKIRPKRIATMFQALLVFVIGTLLFFICPIEFRNSYPAVAFGIPIISYLLSNVMALLLFPFDYDV